jgi:hypothetical protein
MNGPLPSLSKHLAKSHPDSNHRGPRHEYPSGLHRASHFRPWLPDCDWLVSIFDLFSHPSSHCRPLSFTLPCCIVNTHLSSTSERSLGSIRLHFRSYPRLAPPSQIQILSQIASCSMQYNEHQNPRRVILDTANFSAKKSSLDPLSSESSYFALSKGFRRTSLAHWSLVAAAWSEFNLL